MLAFERLYKGFLKVKLARGVAGLDGPSIEDFAGNLEENIAMLVEKFKEKRHKPLPVKQLEIATPGGSKRLIAIPMDATGASARDYNLLLMKIPPVLTSDGFKFFLPLTRVS